MRIMIRTPIYPTEDKSRISKALNHQFPDIIFELIQEENISWLQYKTDNRMALNNLKDMIHEFRIIDAARRILESRWTGTNSSIKLDKQAAYGRKIRLVDQQDEPPLGTIEIILSMDGIDQFEEFLLWVTPPTKDGRIIRN